MDVCDLCTPTFAGQSDSSRFYLTESSPVRTIHLTAREFDRFRQRLERGLTQQNGTLPLRRALNDLFRRNSVDELERKRMR